MGPFTCILALYFFIYVVFEKAYEASVGGGLHGYC